MKRIYGLLIIMMVVAACTKPELTPSNPLQYAQQSSLRKQSNSGNAFNTYKLGHKTSKSLMDSLIVADSTSTPVDTIPVIDTIPHNGPPSIFVNGIPIVDSLQYIKFKSFYSEDGGQSSAFEIEAYYKGQNIALNKPATASSTSFDPNNSMFDATDGEIWHIDDGNYLSRWSSNQRIDGHPSYNPVTYPDSISSDYYHGLNCKSKAFITIDLTKKFLVDSVRLYLFQTGNGADTTNWVAWRQTFGLYVSKDLVKWDSIGGGIRVNQLNWKK